MGFLTIYHDNYIDSTVISNRFIDEYMQSANDAQLKIYLYLIRMMSARLDTSIGDIADKFNYTEKDVVRALKYWEKMRLLVLDYDSHKNITGIHMMDSNSSVPAPSCSTMASHPAVTVSSSLQPSLRPDPVFAVDATQTVAAAAPASYEKPNYTAEDLIAFKSDEESARLLFVAEMYLKRPLSSNDMRTILFIMDKLGFSADLTDYLLQYCVDRGKRDLRYIEKVALSWAEKGISTPKEAAALSGKYDKAVYEVMRALGKNNIPTDTEAAYIKRWREEYGFETDVILTACERTVLATDSHRFEYADGILNRWHKAHVRHKDDIKAMDETHRKSKTTRPVSTSTNKFNQFKQHDYDFEAIQRALEKEIISS